MQYRLLAIDLDGTLLNHEGKVSEANKRAIRAAIEAGFIVCFATGRNYYESMGVIDEVGHYDAAVFVGGASVVDTRHGETLHRQLMDPQLAANVCGVFQRYDLSPIVLQDRETAGVDFLYSHETVPQVVKDWHHRHDAKVRHVDDLTAADHSHTMRISTMGPAPLISSAEAELEARFGERLFYYRVMLGATGAELLETFDPSVNKWAGIQHVANQRGISAEQIVAVGDDYNDIHMIKHAGLGVAMGNAREEIKAMADRVIGSHEHDGLAAFINELIEQSRSAST